MLLECGCAQEDIRFRRNRAGVLHMPRAGTFPAETAGESKRPERVLAVARGTTGDFGGIDANSKAAFIQPGL